MDDRKEMKLNLSFLDNYVLEDEIYLRIDKIQSLCSAQIILDSSDVAASRYVRVHYSMVIEEQLIELRNLLNQLFR